MNSRDYKMFRPGHYYHVFNRGNNKQGVFKDSQDMLVFLSRLRQVLNLPVLRPVRIVPVPEGSFSMVSYCLMPNHFHFQIRQNNDIGIDRLMLKICTSYAMYYNRKYEHIGNVFQDRFKAKLIDNDTYAKYVSAYIHNNPRNLDYDYSSFKDIVGIRDGQIVDRSILLSWFDNNIEAYAGFVRAFNEKDENSIERFLFEE
jgi:putative transposase